MTTRQSEVDERKRGIFVAYYSRCEPRPSQVPSMQICPGLYLGSVGSAYNKKTLTSLRITHILTDFQYKIVEIADEPTEDISVCFEDCTRFITDALQRDGRVLVHCFAGVSRSACIVIAFLMQIHNLTFQEAFTFVKQRRPKVSPNDGFRVQLKEFEEQLKHRAN